MATECAYSFKDLYEAAHNVEPPEEVLLQLYALPQNDRNRIVQEWAVLAGWETRKRIGFDKQIYLAFAPKFDS